MMGDKSDFRRGYIPRPGVELFHAPPGAPRENRVGGPFISLPAAREPCVYALRLFRGINGKACYVLVDSFGLGGRLDSHS
jgi:hypothetical protein